LGSLAKTPDLIRTQFEKAAEFYEVSLFYPNSEILFWLFLAG
jgi:hypothetical protein